MSNKVVCRTALATPGLLIIIALSLRPAGILLKILGSLNASIYTQLTHVFRYQGALGHIKKWKAGQIDFWNMVSDIQ